MNSLFIASHLSPSTTTKALLSLCRNAALANESLAWPQAHYSRYAEVLIELLDCDIPLRLLARDGTEGEDERVNLS